MSRPKPTQLRITKDVTWHWDMSGKRHAVAAKTTIRDATERDSVAVSGGFWTALDYTLDLVEDDYSDITTWALCDTLIIAKKEYFYGNRPY